ncbi:DUF4837 family protein [Saccharicrinis fermentans]|uniref:DUF4837 family protein n=1 Tax=Saccharicrinis fermentans TaxID=982 RepID=UPI000487285B
MNIHKTRSFSHHNSLILILFYFASACQPHGGSIKSRSIGAPGELLVVMDTQLQHSQVKKMIADFANEEFPCIPQPEATFKLSNIKPNDFEGHFKAYRNIIIIRQKKSKIPIYVTKKTFGQHINSSSKSTYPILLHLAPHLKSIALAFSISYMKVTSKPCNWQTRKAQIKN